jgi:hypothetical protein
MGGSGGSPRYRGTSSGITRRIAEARERERERLNTDVNEYLNGLLVRLNARETDETNQRLDRIADILGNVADIEKVLLGGSVAKHTYVDGISDIDALVVLDRQELQGKSPDEVKAAFYAELDSR